MSLAKTDIDVQLEFVRRIQQVWLPAYANDGKRQYGVEGYRASSNTVSAIDANDFMRALDAELVIDQGGGRYYASASKYREIIFWEGRRLTIPRPITLWIEPVITIACVARLHFDYGWPKLSLGLQSKTWAFDLAAYSLAKQSMCIAVEVKKTQKELDRLISDLLKLSAMQRGITELKDVVSTNSFKKWEGLGALMPALLWVVGPNNASQLFSVLYKGDLISLQEEKLDRLTYSPSNA